MGLWDLVLFNLTAIVGLRWLATAARTGPSSLTVWVIAAIVFFIPQGIAVLYLSSRYPEEGGIYRWTRHALGDFHGFFCGWCYWVTNLVYYPSLLIFAAATTTWIAGPNWTWLGERPWFTSLAALLMLWIAIGANVVGLNIGKWVHNIGGLSTWLPGIALVVLGGIAYFRAGSANEISAATLVPSLDLGTLSFWSTIAFAFAGLELGPVMSGEIRDPQRNIRRAIFLSSGVIAVVYILGTLAVLVVVPAREVNVVTGALQTIDAVVRHAGFGSVTALIALLLTLGSIGGTGAWLAGSARIPFVAGIDRFLPAAFGRVHPRWKTPHVAILTQGFAATFFLLLTLPGGTVAENYLLLAELTIITYFVPYLYLFTCAMRLGGSRTPAVVGFITTVAAILVSLIPSAEVQNPLIYEVKLLIGTVVFFGTGILLYYVRKPNRGKENVDDGVRQRRKERA